MTNHTQPIDELDRRILELFAAEPRLGVLEASRRLQVARGTVQARLERLQDHEVITDWAPTVSPDALGYVVTAFVTCEIDQGSGRQQVADHLASIPEVLECWTITGEGDLWVRVVARSNADVQRVIDQMNAYAGVLRTSTLIGLKREFGYRTEPLVQHTGDELPEDPGHGNGHNGNGNGNGNGRNGNGRNGHKTNGTKS